MPRAEPGRHVQGSLQVDVGASAEGSLRQMLLPRQGFSASPGMVGDAAATMARVRAMEALLEARRAAAREKYGQRQSSSDADSSSPVPNSPAPTVSRASTDGGGATDTAGAIDRQLAAVDRRLDAYVSIPVVSTLLFGAALSIVFDRELIEHLEGCPGLGDSGDNNSADESGSHGACTAKTCTTCATPVWFDILASAFMHLAVGLNLVSTMIQTAVFYFGKRTLGYEVGDGDWIRRAKRFLDSDGTRSWLSRSFNFFITSILCFGVGLASTIWVLLPTRWDVASIATLVYLACIVAALVGFFKIRHLANEQWSVVALPEDEQRMRAMEAEIAELDELEIAQLSSKIEREVALARGDAAGARTLAGPPRGLPDIASGSQLSDLAPSDSLEVVAPEPEPELEARG